MIRMNRTQQIFALALGLFLLSITTPACAPAVGHAVASSAQPFSAEQQGVLRELKQANVVYLGETHDRAADHAAQLQIIQALHQHHPQMAIAMEMFQRQYQTVLDQYLAGAITEAELRQQSDYDQRWGFDWEYYAPILRFAQAHQIPVIALNTPTEVTHRVARQGLGALSETDQQWIPPLADIHLGPKAYRQMLQDIYQHSHAGMTASSNFDRFFAAQVLWDETMAEGITTFLQENPDSQVIALMGQGHVVYGYGVPDRVARRMAEQPDFVQRTVLLNPSAAALAEGTGAIADYFWLSAEISDDE